MRLHALLILPLVVLQARAASIPDHIVPELEEKLSEAVKEVLDKDAIALKDDLNDQELLDRVNAVDNVATESEPSVKTEDAPASEDESASLNIYRPVAIDLNNPGPPQVQRHDFQNPEVFNEAKLKESSVSHTIAETQNVLHEGLLDINQKAREPALNDEKISLVRNSINELQENFSSQLRALNDIIKKYSKPEEASTLRSVAVLESESPSTQDLKKVESEFNNGIENLSEGLAHLKANGDNTGSTTAAPSSTNFIQLFFEQFQKFQTTVQTNLSNLNTAVLNALNGTQSNGSGASTPGLFQNPLAAINNVINPQNQQQQQQPQQQQGFFPNLIQGISNTVTGWFTPAQAQPNPTAQPATPAGGSPATSTNAEVSTEAPQKTVELTTASGPIEQSGSEVVVEAAKDAEGPSEKGHGGGYRPEYSDNGNILRIASEVANVEHRTDATEQPEMATEQNGNELSDNKVETLVEEVTMKIDNSDYKEKATEEESLEITTQVEELHKNEESVTEVVPIIFVRSKEENLMTEELQSDVPTTGLPSLKEEVTTVMTDVMLNEEPKVENRISTDTSNNQDFKSETTVLPVNEIEIELSTEEILTEGIKEILMRDGLLAENTPIKEMVESEVSGTEVPEINVVTKKEESTTNVVKAEEPITTSNPVVEVETRNQEAPVTEAEIKKIEEEEVRTTEGSALGEQDLNLEVLPTEELKKDDIENEPTTEVPKAEDIKEEKKETKRRVIRRLIKRTLL